MNGRGEPMKTGETCIDPITQPSGLWVHWAGGRMEDDHHPAKHDLAAEFDAARRAAKFRSDQQGSVAGSG
jgi:hypothetical protein